MIDAPDKTVIDPKTLADAFDRWWSYAYPTDALHSSFQWTPVRSPMYQEFESMLFDMGGRIVRNHKKRYAVFNEEKCATLFLLRWA